MHSDAVTVADYLAGLPDDKRAIVTALRDIVLANLPDGYVEAMGWGMISYDVPMEKSGRTYNGKPLMYAAIGAQKNHVALYLCGLYCAPHRLSDFEADYRASGCRFDMGKACLRIRKPEDIHASAIAAAIASTPVDEFIALSRGRAR